jgi:hypothetical protein
MLAATAFCQELDVAIERVRAAIDAADAVPTFSKQQQAYINAAQFYDRETGLLSETWIAWGDACTKLAKEGDGYATALTSALRAHGIAVDTYAPGYEAPASIAGDVATWGKWLTVAAVLGAGGYLLMNVKAFVPRRRLAGYASHSASHRRRRRAR